MTLILVSMISILGLSSSSPSPAQLTAGRTDKAAVAREWITYFKERTLILTPTLTLG